MSSHINSTVTPSFQFAYDEHGESQITIERLNQLASPTVNTDLTGLVALSDLDEDLVTLLPKVSISTDDLESGNGTGTIQVQDANANSLTAEYAVRVWISTSDKGAAEAVTSFTVAAAGVLVGTLTTNAALVVSSDSSGLIVVDVDNGGSPGTFYIMAEINGLVFSAQLEIT